MPALPLFLFILALLVLVFGNAMEKSRPYADSAALFLTIIGLLILNWSTK